MWFTIGVIASILSYTWLLEPRLPRGFVVVPGAIVLGLGVWHACRTGEWGFRAAALLSGARAAALLTAPIVVGILLAGAARGTLHDRGSVWEAIPELLLWAGAQQWVLQTLVLRESQRATSRTAGIPLAAVLFAAVHAPNPFLVAMTLAGGLI